MRDDGGSSPDRPRVHRGGIGASSCPARDRHKPGAPVQTRGVREISPGANERLTERLDDSLQEPVVRTLPSRHLARATLRAQPPTLPPPGRGPSHVSARALVRDTSKRVGSWALPEGADGHTGSVGSRRRSSVPTHRPRVRMIRRDDEHVVVRRFWQSCLIRVVVGRLTDPVRRRVHRDVILEESAASRG